MTAASDERIARHVRVTGRVQGVFFRGWTRDQAEALGVAGWVRNCPDGSVEASLTGSAAAVTDLIARMRRGPPGAAVASLEVSDGEPATGAGFDILRG